MSRNYSWWFCALTFTSNRNCATLGMLPTRQWSIPACGVSPGTMLFGRHLAPGWNFKKLVFTARVVSYHCCSFLLAAAVQFCRSSKIDWLSSSTASFTLKAVQNKAKLDISCFVNYMIGYNVSIKIYKLGCEKAPSTYPCQWVSEWVIDYHW